MKPNNEPKNLRLDFGAMGDGTTDDTAAFVRARDSGISSLYVPTGAYLLSAFNFSVANQKWQLAPDAMLVCADGVNPTFLTVSASGVRISGGTINGRRPTITGTVRADGIVVTAADVQIRQMEIRDAFGVGFYAQSVSNVWVEDVQVYDSVSTGIDFYAYFADMDDCVVRRVLVDRTGLTGTYTAGGVQLGGYRPTDINDANRRTYHRLLVDQLVVKLPYSRDSNNVCVENWNCRDSHWGSIQTSGGGMGVSFAYYNYNNTYDSIVVYGPGVRGGELGGNGSGNLYGLVAVDGANLAVTGFDIYSDYVTIGTLMSINCGLETSGDKGYPVNVQGGIGLKIGTLIAKTAASSSLSGYTPTTGAVVFLDGRTGGRYDTDFGAIDLDGGGTSLYGIRLLESDRLSVGCGRIANVTTAGCFVNSTVNATTLDSISLQGVKGLTMSSSLTGGSALGTNVRASGPDFAINGKSAEILSLKSSGGHVIRAWGTGTPEGTVVAAIGSMYYRTDGGAGTTAYAKESGTSNTGWKALTESTLGTSQVVGGYLSLPGGNAYTSTPRATANATTLDVDLQIEFALTTANNGLRVGLLGRWTESGNQRCYALSIHTDGKLRLNFSDDGTNSLSGSSSVVLPIQSGEFVAVRGTRVKTTGVCTFYTSADHGATWTQLGTTVVANANTAIFDSSTAPFQVAPSIAGAQNLIGGVRWAKMFSTISGSTVNVFEDFRELLLGTTSFVESSTNAATVTIA